MVSLGGPAGDMVGALRGVLGLTRPSRIRQHLDETIDIYAKLTAFPELESSSTHLASVIERQSAHLLAVVAPDSRRKWDWASFVITLVLAAIVISPGYFWLWDRRDSWWAVVLLVLCALLGSLLFLASLLLLLGREPVNEG